ncbi:MAG: hypothetical protein M1816_006381 [Peltula sp. TS41687]|nr:MAG: hypothetical protein M1816_006381 [Peltula sp. TS41687]
MALQEPSSPPPRLRYTTVTGYFKQDELSTDAETFDYTAANFGLLKRDYETDTEDDPGRHKTQWQRFQHHLSGLNTQSGPGVQFRVLYLARHGEGYHNVAEAFYGTEEWDRYWSRQTGDATFTWIDAHLTARGVMQAQDAHEFWRNELNEHKIPPPQSYYVSPLYRCLDTAKITFSELELPQAYPFVPEIKEVTHLLRVIADS